MLNSSPHRVLTHIFKGYLPKGENMFADNSRAEPATFNMENISFSLKFLSGRFYEFFFCCTP